VYNGKRVIVLDLETQKSFAEIDRSKLHLLKVSTCGIYDSFDDQYHAYEENELHKVEQRLKLADLIVGFNIIDFDMRVLGPYLLCDVRPFKVLDLMQEIAKVRGHRVSLQSVAQATLHDSKSGSGFDAIQLYKDGRMDDLKKYCLDDVRITKAVFDYGLKHKHILFYSNRDFMTHQVELDWSGSLEAPKETQQIFPSSLF